MRVALLGNMNNNHFAVMRYMRDLGVDAYLLLYNDEIVHFLPENDTWEIERWQPYIIQTNLPNGNLINYWSTSNNAISKELGDFDVYFGNGFAPAYFLKAKKKLDAFIPYGVGIEFIYGNTLKIKMSSPAVLKKSVFELIYRYYQRKGIAENTSYGIASEPVCISCLERLNITIKRWDIPMVYNQENLDCNNLLTEEIVGFKSRMQSADLVVFSHVSHIYKNVPKILDIKKNYILIEGFAAYIKEKKVSNPLLVLFEYGKDVSDSKKLIRNLEIEDYVLWIPKMARKEIMSLLDCVDIGGGEFGGVIWGGTGWEFLAKGIPFLQYVNITPEDYLRSQGKPLPPFFNVQNAEEIKKVLLRYEQNRSELEDRGKQCKEWFNSYNGINLVKEYLDLLQIPVTVYDNI